MDNHYHLLIETPDVNLSKGIRQLNGVYTQSSNRNNNRVDQVFQVRFEAIQVQRESYLRGLSRYIVLNPVAGITGIHSAGWNGSIPNGYSMLLV